MNFITKTLDFQSKILFKNSSWVFLANSFGALLAFLKAIVIARVLGAELYGIFTVIIVFIGTIQEVFNLNLGAAIIRFGSKFRSENRPDKVVSILKLSLAASSIAALTSILVISLFTIYSYDTFIKAPHLEWFAIIYVIAASSLLFNQVSRGALRLFFRFKKNSMVQVIMDSIDFVIIITALFWFPNNLEIFLITILITRFINGLIPNLAAWKELHPELSLYISSPVNLVKNESKAIRKFVITNSIAKTLQSLINRGDILLLALITSNPLQVAYYAVGKKLAFSILTLTDPLITSVYPQICKLYADKDIKSIKQMLYRLTLLALIPSLIFMGFAYFFNQWVMTTVFGMEYIAAGQVFYIITGASLIQAIFFWIHPLLQALDLMVIRLRIYITGILAGLISAFLLVPQYDSTGMAITIVIVNALMPGMFLYHAIRKLNKSEYEN